EQEQEEEKGNRKECGWALVESQRDGCDEEDEDEEDEDEQKQRNEGRRCREEAVELVGVD
ncbi:hypothetical protein ACJ73_09511, partial [Blastomyces percursus]